MNPKRPAPPQRRLVRDDRYVLDVVLSRWRWDSYDFELNADDDAHCLIRWRELDVDVLLKIDMNNISSGTYVFLRAEFTVQGWRAMDGDQTGLLRIAPFQLFSRSVLFDGLKPPVITLDRGIAFDLGLQTAIMYAIKKLRAKGVTWTSIG